MAATKKGVSASVKSTVNPHESLSGLARFFADGLKTQAIDQGIKKLPGDAWREIAGLHETATPQKGEMKMGQAVDLRSADKKAAVPQNHTEVAPRPRQEILGGIDYRREVVQGVQMRRSREQQELDQKLQEIMAELKRLVKSSTLLSHEYASISVSDKPAQAGSYHVNFFDFMLSVLKTARMKVEDSGAWMAVSKKKNGYHQKAKSLGTKFTLSQERSTATQTG